ncbi:hypothetical protein ACD591_18115 [Rufibacter glacialis]|uniref:DUF4890 domain-containing protein n=1 Tax=Rufibacter glacialis TaxID=1259555 RepID=A0A5M8Q7G2_9BACT|nr:hypothetical protein [Rufibacter glacialis]KAA6430760.1 hypothetical protein FOE74_20035 [Rufibacter glacialis]GGK86512.1 hypothetical protein GCM10011405_37820 [Rufibacter glacialis]
MKIKSTLLALVLSFSLLGVSTAQTTPSASAVAREIANALKLNEAEYLKVTKLENARREELKRDKSNEAAINEKFTAALLQTLNADQQKAFHAFVKENPISQLAKTK